MRTSNFFQSVNYHFTVFLLLFFFSDKFTLDSTPRLNSFGMRYSNGSIFSMFFRITDKNEIVEIQNFIFPELLNFFIQKYLSIVGYVSYTIQF